MGDWLLLIAVLVVFVVGYLFAIKAAKFLTRRIAKIFAKDKETINWEKRENSDIMYSSDLSEKEILEEVKVQCFGENKIKDH